MELGNGSRWVEMLVRSAMSRPPPAEEAQAGKERPTSCYQKRGVYLISPEHANNTDWNYSDTRGLAEHVPSLFMIESSRCRRHLRRWLRTKNVAENGRHIPSIELPPFYQALSRSQ
jgi:hypothetical protein